MKKWALHVCLLDKNCRAVGAPKRVHVTTPWFHWAFAMTPASKFAGRLDERPRWTTFEKRKS